MRAASEVELPWDQKAAPVEYAQRQARVKTLAIAESAPNETVLGADTIVVVGGAVLGKPADKQEARQMLSALSGRGHEVITAFRVQYAEVFLEEAVSTEVVFRKITETEIDGYLASNEWQGKAGAYAIQGIAGAFVSKIHGSYPNVVGLPITEVVLALRSIGALPHFPIQARYAVE